MDDLYISGTNKSPQVDFKTNGKLYISGRSFLENNKEFYKPLIDWLQEYIKNPAPETIMEFDFEYFNTSSEAWLFRIIEVLYDLVKLNKKIEYIWHYNDEEMYEIGEDLASLLGLQMKYIKKEL